MRLHHVQLSCPPGGEPAARAFWVDALGLIEVAKPEPLASRGGCWFRHGALEVHVGIEDGFAPARKAHPAVLLDDVAALEALGGRLLARGFEVDWTERHTFPGHERLHTLDAHDNRVEVLAPA